MRVRAYVLGLFFSGGAFIISTLCVKYVFQTQIRVPMYTIPEVSKQTRTAGPKTIVWYDVAHNDHGLRRSVSNAKFDTCQDAATNCIILPHIIADGTRGPGVIDADAVIVQGCHITSKLALPTRRDSNQVFVFAERENWYANSYSKFEARENLLLYQYKDAFNWTMTYRHDSDIIFPYGWIRKSSEVVNRNNFRSVYSKKKYDAAWFVSHCETPSQRMKFVTEMQKYITVHIYGKCGKFSCPKKLVDRDPEEDCVQKVIEQYKFYLSFENSYRPNYVTEKLFDWFPRDIIPVVRGGGGNYSKYGIPDGTIIDADKYTSAKELALKLKAIGSSQPKYIKYLKRKQGYFAVSKDDAQTESYCKLCEMLQDVQNNRKSYTHMGAWWDSELFSDSIIEDNSNAKTYYFILFLLMGSSVILYKMFMRKPSRQEISCAT